MESLICLDSSTLIDYYRTKNKNKSFFFSLSLEYQGFILPVTAHFEVMVGSNENQHTFWKNLFEDFLLIPYQPHINSTVIQILKQLKTKRKSIDYKYLLIAATAKHYNYSLATINEKHFEAIEGLKLITPTSFKP